jgi:hypothetical protein
MVSTRVSKGVNATPVTEIAIDAIVSRRAASDNRARTLNFD